MGVASGHACVWLASALLTVRWAAFATAPDSQEFEAPILDVSPKPSLSGTLKPGDLLEGWLVFLVPQKVSEPVMVFREDVGIVSHAGGGTWFQLYVRLTSRGQPKP